MTFDPSAIKECRCGAATIPSVDFELTGTEARPDRQKLGMLDLLSQLTQHIGLHRSKYSPNRLFGSK